MVEAKIYDFILIGGGIVGVSCALQLKQRYPDALILLIEKEILLARHQTGHNSGVIHAGVYYTPGSMKAELCKRGAALTIAFCKEYGVPFEQCGKLLVATNEVEYERMNALEARCQKNGIDVQRLSEEDLRRREPNVNGIGALYVPATCITDYRIITMKMAERFQALNGKIITGAEVRGIKEEKNSILIQIGDVKARAKYVITCGGLMADRLVRMMGIDIDFQIIPFRGEYYQLSAKHNHIVKHLIYPIPDPALPFLGVHLTRMIDGTVTIGPNAVLGLKREGYGRINFNFKDFVEMIFYTGFWKGVRNNFKSGVKEIKDSFYKPAYLKRVHKYCSLIKLPDLYPYPAGIRAQAVKRDGSLVHDFLFSESECSLHVCNAPSPAATSAIPIAEFICNRAKEKFRL